MVLRLPSGVSVLERGWLSSNNVLIQGPKGTALIDSGYCLHAQQTLSLVQAALQGRALDTLINTHLHSDHCGGNAALQAAYPQLRTLIPPGQAKAVRQWDADALSYTPTGQNCPPFRFDDVLQPGTSVRLGDLDWQVHAAPGHDPHSIVLWEPASRTLISADALWERGFGVVFPELDGVDAFMEVAQTIDLIESLQPVTVIPGHGAPFGADAVAPALAYARKRLQGFVDAPDRHRDYAAKVLVKFKLLELQQVDMSALVAWAGSTAYLPRLMNKVAGDETHTQGSEEAQALLAALLQDIIQDLVRANAARVHGAMVYNL
jgi:glyoxylase-like metal-dependent hydrolase (beta-lactamase superfamily II)